jgi:DNA-binding beta-propeller fold protein YncE
LGEIKRELLREQDFQINPANLRVAALPFQFGLGSIPARPNRLAFLSGTAEQQIRSFNTSSFELGRPIAVPVQPRAFALRPLTDEAWTLHSGPANQAVVTNLREERQTASFVLRLNPEAIPISLHFSANGQTAWAVVRNPEGTSERGQILTIDCATRQVVNTVSLGANTPFAAVLSPDSARLLLSVSAPGGAGGLTQAAILEYSTPAGALFSLASGQQSVAQQPPNELHIVPGGGTLYWLNSATGNVDQFDLGARRVVRQLPLPRTSILSAMAISHTGEIATVRDSTGVRSYLLDLTFGTVLDGTVLAVGQGFFLPRF